MECTTLYYSYLQEQSSIGVDKQWVEGRDATGGKLVCKSGAGNLGALPIYEGLTSLCARPVTPSIRVMVVV